MGALYDALAGLSSVQDAELQDGFRRYEAVLATILTTEQMEQYAIALRQAGEIRIFEELTTEELATLTPEERTIATRVCADENVSMENRRVVALLNQRGEHAIAPDLGSSPQTVQVHER